MKALLILFPFLMFSQEHIQLELHQDLRLTFVGDGHSNRSGTLDFKVGVALQGRQFDWYYFEIKPQFEYANLSGGKYVSWLVNGGWVFNQLFINRLEAGAYLTTGLLHRFDTGYLTYGMTFELSYKITKKLKFGVMMQVMTRPDLKEIWNDTGIKPNGYFGVKYIIR